MTDKSIPADLPNQRDELGNFRNIASDMVINDVLKKAFGSQISDTEIEHFLSGMSLGKVSSNVGVRVTPQQLSEQLIKTLGADGAKLARLMDLPTSGGALGTKIRDLVADQVIDAKLSGLFGDDISTIAPHLKDTIKPEEISKKLIGEFGKDGVKIAANLGLPVDADIAKQYGIEIVRVETKPSAFDNIKGIPSADM